MKLDAPEGNFPPTRRTMAASLFFAGYASAAVSSCASPVTTPHPLDGRLAPAALLWREARPCAVQDPDAPPTGLRSTPAPR